METDATEQAERKYRSEAILRANDVPVHEGLPAIESVSETAVRSVEEIAPRALCLLIAAGKGAGLPQTVVDDLVKSHEIAGYFTPEEAPFIPNPEPPEKQMIAFSWRSEASWVLLWALGFVDSLGLPKEFCQTDVAIDIVEENRLAGMIANAQLRPTSQILDEADLIYRCHWAARQADLAGQEPPEALDLGVTMERHHALNWLIRYEDQAWDDVTTDT